MFRVAIIGLGDISSLHIAAVQRIPNVKIVALCDTDLENKDMKVYGDDISLYSDYKEMLQREHGRGNRLDIVHICLPHYLHASYIKELHAMGIHIFCEKPLCTNHKELEELRDLKTKDIQVGICLQNRYNESVRTLKSKIESLEYGKVVGVRAEVLWNRTREYYALKPWRGSIMQAGSGVLLNQAIHTLDLCTYLVGDVRSFKSLYGNLLDYNIEVEDSMMASLTFTNGAKGLFIATNANDRNDSVYIRITLEEAEFVIQDYKSYQIHSDGSVEFLIEDRSLEEESGILEEYKQKTYYGASHILAIREFYECIEQNKGFAMDIKEAAKSMELALGLLGRDNS